MSLAYDHGKIDAIIAAPQANRPRVQHAATKLTGRCSAPRPTMAKAIPPQPLLCISPLENVGASGMNREKDGSRAG